jgi:GH43 family beta-xylosidase
MTKPELMTLIRRTGQTIALSVTMMLSLSLACRDDHASPPLTSVVDDNTFKNPVLTTGPDPWVVQQGKTYYVTHTTGNSLKLYKTEDMTQIARATSKVIWTPPASGMNSKEIWAPEIHRINDAWYFYYAADDGKNANHRMWVLENKSADPFQGTWTDKGQLNLPDNKWAIDGTVLSQNGQLYFLWSGWEGDTDVRQDIYIVKMSNPWTPEGPRVRLSKPELPWEMVGSPPGVNEGPQVLNHSGKLFVVYSASGCWTDDYTLGLLTADENSDLINPASWTKSAQPVFSKNPEGQVYGPGHCSFFVSPNGQQDWILYHANPQTGQGCGNARSIRMQPFTWKSDGSPDFGKAAALDVALEKPASQ